MCTAKLAVAVGNLKFERNMRRELYDLNAPACRGNLCARTAAHWFRSSEVEFLAFHQRQLSKRVAHPRINNAARTLGRGDLCRDDYDTPMFASKVRFVVVTCLPWVPRSYSVRWAARLTDQPFGGTNDHMLMLYLVEVLVGVFPEFHEHGDAGLDRRDWCGR